MYIFVYIIHVYFLCVYIYIYIYIYLRAAAPAADPETKHPERQFFLFLSCSFFLDITFQILEDKKPPQNVGETMLPPCLCGFYTD